MTDSLNIRWSRTIPKAARVTTVTISKDPAGRYFVSLLCDDAVAPLPKTFSAIGIDLGPTYFITTSTGEKIAASKTFRKYEGKLAKVQRRLAKKQKGSKNRIKARLKVAKIHTRDELGIPFSIGWGEVNRSGFCVLTIKETWILCRDNLFRRKSDASIYP